MKAFFSCGIGDFFAIERFMTETEKTHIREVYFCTRMAEQLESLIVSTGIFPNVERFFSLHNDWWRKEGDIAPFCVTDVRSVNRILGRMVIPRHKSRHLVDFSCKKVMDDIARRTRTYQRSSCFDFYQHRAVKLDLPPNYVVIHPFSDNNQHPERDFTATDWQRIFRRLERNSQTGIVVNRTYNQYDPITHPNIIDMTNTLSLDDSLSVVAQASEFIGCASLHSVLFTKSPKPSVVKAQWQMFDRPSSIHYKFYYGNNPVNPNMRITGRHQLQV